MIIAGDVGGTHARLGIFETDEHANIRQTASAEYNSSAYPGLGAVARQFLDEHSASAEICCFGIAGPVEKGRARPTNLPWEVDAKQISTLIGMPVLLINDLVANAYGVATLGPEDMVTLQEGVGGQEGNAGVIAAGTGLGEAGLFWDGKIHRPFGSEGGHSDFAARTPREAAMLDHLLTRFDGRVSWERVLSGRGLVNVYEFLRDTNLGVESPQLAELMRQSDPSAVISHAALEKTSDICRLALDIFTACYGAEAGNIALQVMAVNGMYVGGGIAPKIIEKLKSGVFMEAFRAKGRLRPLMERIPVHVILNEKTALRGAARCGALELLKKS